MTSHQRRRRRFGERTSGHLSRRKEVQPGFSNCLLCQTWRDVKVFNFHVPCLSMTVSMC
ncbi:hypothetical protein OIU74_019469 [Salix koriyanagi]|uniref:Uncharacterized protein n=1 Tax=Salix koriyanagi TaxID=2511006 RepID=A0A9Q0P3P6_9ROSI|nr:hypothetical protein OIU74_019469 [Salix koriyanagi]